jgi:hypothetical protein
VERLWGDRNREVFTMIRHMVFRVAAVGALLVAPGVAWGGPAAAASGIYYADVAVAGDPDDGGEFGVLQRRSDGPPIITGEDDLVVNQGAPDTIIVTDPGGGDGKGPKAQAILTTVITCPPPTKGAVFATNPTGSDC